MLYFSFIHKLYGIIEIPNINGQYYIKQSCNQSRYKIYILEVNNKNHTKKNIDNRITYIFDIYDEKLYKRSSSLNIWLPYSFLNIENIEKTVTIDEGVNTTTINITPIYYVSPNTQISYIQSNNTLILNLNNLVTGEYFSYYTVYIQDNLLCTKHKIFTINRYNLLYLRAMTKSTIYLAYLNMSIINPSNNLPSPTDPGFVLGGEVIQGDTTIETITWSSMTPYISNSGIFTAPYSGNYTINLIFSYSFEANTLLSDAVPYIIIRKGSSYNQGEKLISINVINITINNGSQQQYGISVADAINIVTNDKLLQGDNICIEYHSNNATSNLILSPPNSQSLLIITYNGDI